MLFPKIKEKIGRPERGERVWRRKYLEVELNEERRDLGERVRGELEEELMRKMRRSGDRRREGKESILKKYLERMEGREK